MTRSAPDRVEKIVGGIAGPGPRVAGDDIVERLAPTAHGTFIIAAALLARSAHAAAENVAQQVVQRAALWLRGALLRLRARGLLALSAAQYVAEQIIKPAATLGLRRWLGRALLGATAHLLEYGAKHHGSDDWQHLLQDGCTNAGRA